MRKIKFLCNSFDFERPHHNYFLSLHQAFWKSKMGRKDASAIKLPVDQYRKQIGKQ